MAEQIELVTIKLKKSLICSTKPQLATARALGLRKIGDITIQPNNPATQGKIRVLRHLLEIKEGGAEA